MPPDPRDDPSVVEMEDGSMWQRDEASKRWTRLSGPRQEEAPRRRREGTDIDWGIIFWGIVFLFAIIGFVSVVVGLRNGAIGCHLGSTEGCFFTLPPVRR